MIEVQLTRIIISEVNENQAVFLKEVDGDRQFPINRFLRGDRD